MRRTLHGFTILEALMAVAISAALIVGMATQSGTTFRFFTQSDDTLASARAAQLLLAYLKEDLSQADSPGGGDITVSPGTGTVFPKAWVHLTHDTDTSNLQLFAYAISESATPLTSSDPIAAKPASDPMTRLALTRAARVQNAFAWIDPGQQRAKYFVVNVRSGAELRRVTYTYQPDTREVVRQAADGATHIGTGSVTGFSATPYLEFLVPRQRDQPLDFLKCWVEVQIDVRAPQKADPVNKKPISIHTKLVPRLLIAMVRGLSPF